MSREYQYYGLFVAHSDQPEQWEIIPLLGETFSDASNEADDICSFNTRVDSCLWIDSRENLESLQRALALLPTAEAITYD